MPEQKDRKKLNYDEYKLLRDFMESAITMDSQNSSDQIKLEPRTLVQVNFFIFFNFLFKLFIFSNFHQLEINLKLENFNTFGYNFREIKYFQKYHNFQIKLHISQNLNCIKFELYKI